MTSKKGEEMILTIGGIKGGSGKSLTATNLTVMKALKGSKILLIDGDEQGTVGDWVDHRNSLGIKTTWTTIRLKANAIRTEVLKLANDYDDIIIDCGGRDTASLRAALTVSDVFLVPFQPKSFDIWTTEKVSLLISEAKSFNEKLHSFAFINCADARGRDNDAAKKIIGKSAGLDLLPITVGLRKAFSNATSEGLSVVEMKKDEKAIGEIRRLYTAVFKSKWNK